MYDRILVAGADDIDGNSLIPHALEIADRFGAELTVLIVVIPHGGPYRFDIEAVDDLNQAAATVKRQLEDDRLGADVPLSVSIRRGNPHEIIEAVAAETAPDLLIRHHRILNEHNEAVPFVVDRDRELDRPTLLVPESG